MRFFKPGRHLSLADKARDSRDWVKAAQSYERYLRRRPGNAPIWVQLGHMYKESGRYPSAASAYQRAVSLAPEDADIHLQIGHLNKLSGNYRLALLSYRQALVLDPSMEAARRELGLFEDEASPINDEDRIVLLEKQVKTLTGRVAMLEQAMEAVAP